MEFKNALTAGWIAITASLLVCPTAFATPKAAEHENAPVTFGADSPKPKKLAVTKKPVPPKGTSAPRAKQTHATGSKRRK